MFLSRSLRAPTARLMLLVTATAALAACGDSPPPQVAAPQQYVAPQVAALPAGAPVAAPAPVVVQQESSSSVMPALLGGAVGYMLGRNSPQAQAPQPSYYPERTRTIVRERVIERPVMRPPTPKVAPAPASRAPAAFPSSRPAPKPSAPAPRSFPSSRNR